MSTTLAIRDQVMHAIPTVSTEDIEKALTIGDLAKMPPEVRIRYYLATCQSAGLNPMTQPFTPMKNQAGQIVLYANKECAEQLRKRDRISVRVLSREREDTIYIVTVAASTPDGRCEESQGIVDITGLKGVNLANAMMRAETKAKRRVTMALCGLGFQSDDEWAGVPVAFNPQTGEILQDALEAIPITDETGKSLQAHIADLYGDRAPADPRRSLVGQQIDAILTEEGVAPEDQDAYWQKLSQKYPDLTPGVLGLARDQLLAKQAATRQVSEPENAENPSLWDAEDATSEARDEIPF